MSVFLAGPGERGAGSLAEVKVSQEAHFQEVLEEAIKVSNMSEEDFFHKDNLVEEDFSEEKNEAEVRMVRFQVKWTLLDFVSCHQMKRQKEEYMEWWSFVEFGMFLGVLYS
ncbi:uncharacterized protein LOC144763955 [Lissotriton helveticus]